MVIGYKIAFNSIITEKFFIGLNTVYGFEPSFTERQNPNHLNNY